MCLIAAAIIPLWKTKDNWLRAYFVAQIVCDVALIAQDSGSVRYEFIFTVTTFAILMASAFYTFDRYKPESWLIRRNAIVACITLPVFVVALTITTLKEYLPNSAITIALGESAALIALSVGLATVARKEPVPWILAVLWSSLAVWEYSFSLGLPLAPETFLWLNEWLPAVLVITAFLFVGKYTTRPIPLVLPLHRQSHAR